MKLAPNNFVIIGGIVIIGIGWFTAASQNKPVSRVVIGGLVFLLLASLLDLAGGQIAKLTNALVGLALTTVIIVDGPELFKALNTATSKGK